jgi:Flp pilus assembly protein TadD
MARRVACLFLALTFLVLSGCKPPGPRALLQGKALLEKGKYEQALEKLKTATTLLSTNANAWNYLGIAYQHCGQAGEAEQAYHKALALDHDLSEAHYNLGCLMLEQRKPETARNELTAYILRRGNSLESLLRLGSAQLRSRDFSGAEKTFSDSARLSPTNAESLNGLGMVRIYQRRPTEAGQFFNAALHHDPQYAPAILNLAVIALNAQDRQSALRRLKEYASLAPHAENTDAVAAAIQKLERELAPVPMPAVAPTLAPHTASVTAAVSPEQKAAPQPTSPPPPRASYPYQSLTKPKSTRHAEAEKVFAQGLQAQQANRVADSITAYRSATKLDPAYFDAWYNLGVVAGQAADFKTALDAYEHALAINSDSLDARYNFALTLLQSNYPADAANELEKLLTKYPNEARAHLAAGNLYAQQIKDNARARDHYLRVLQLDPQNRQAEAIRTWVAANKE